MADTGNEPEKPADPRRGVVTEPMKPAELDKYIREQGDKTLGDYVRERQKVGGNGHEGKE